MERDFKSNHNWTYSCKYPIVFCPKYRRKVLVAPIDQRLKEIIHGVAEETRSEILEMKIIAQRAPGSCAYPLRSRSAIWYRQIRAVDERAFLSIVTAGVPETQIKNPYSLDE